MRQSGGIGQGGCLIIPKSQQIGHAFAAGAVGPGGGAGGGQGGGRIRAGGAGGGGALGGVVHAGRAGGALMVWVCGGGWSGGAGRWVRGAPGGVGWRAGRLAGGVRGWLSWHGRLGKAGGGPAAWKNASRWARPSRRWPIGAQTGRQTGSAQAPNRRWRRVRSGVAGASIASRHRMIASSTRHKATASGAPGRGWGGAMFILCS